MLNSPDSIIAQHNAIQTLEKIYNSKRIPHALLFSGKEGVGKHFTAIQFAKLVNRSSDDSNNNLLQKKIESLSEPYLKYVIPLPRGKGETGEDNATEKLSSETMEEIINEIKNKANNPYHKITISKANNIKINSIREIKHFVELNYDDLKYRVIIINDAHLMNDEAQNALLKNLEEPPAGVIFILITPFKEKLLQTIQSRCWTINFEPLKENDLKKILSRYFSIEQEQCELVAPFANGSVTAAVELLNNDFEYFLDKVISILRYSLAKKYNSAFSEIDEIIDKHPDSFPQVILLILKWLTDVVKNKLHLTGYYFEKYRDTIEKFNARFQDANIDLVFNALEIILTSKEKNVSLNLISMCVIFETASIVTRK